MSNQTRVTAQLDLGPGAVVEGRYELVKVLGEGGFAAVYEAWDRSIERTVALKILDVGLVPNDDETRDRLLSRFRREAKIAGSIKHPGVVGIYDYGFMGDLIEHPYIVMERLEGWDLEEQIFHRGPLPPGRALPLFIGALEALGEAHEQGIVHKDLKPGNIFYAEPDTSNESLRIVDFGVAFMENAAEGRLTQTGEILGTPNYLAPEYINEQIVSPALDVYQMGLILLELLSARRVVDGSTAMRCLYTHMSGELKIPSALVESELGPILMVALANDYERRFANGTAFANALRTVDPSGIPTLPDGDIPFARPLVTETSPNAGAETESLEGREREDSGQTLLGLGEVEEFDTDRFLSAARRTGALSAKQTSRLIELDEVFAANPNKQGEEADPDPGTSSDNYTAPSTEPRAASPGTEPVSDPQPSSAGRTDDQVASEPTGPQGGIEARAPSMWQFTGDAFADDDGGLDGRGGSATESEPEPEPKVEIYDPGTSRLSIALLLVGAISVVAAGGAVAYFVISDEAPPEEASAKSVPSEAEKSKPSVEETPADGETAASESGADMADTVARRAGLLAAGLAAPPDGEGTPRQEEKETAVDEPETPQPAEEPRPRPAHAEKPRAAEEREPEAPREGKSLWIEVNSTPSRAMVTTEGKLVGMTPCKVKFEPGEQSQRVRFDKDGHEPVDIELRRDDYPGRSVTLPAKNSASEPEPEPDPEVTSGDDSEEEGVMRVAP